VAENTAVGMVEDGVGLQQENQEVLVGVAASEENMHDNKKWLANSLPT